MNRVSNCGAVFEDVIEAAALKGRVLPPNLTNQKLHFRDLLC